MYKITLAKLFILFEIISNCLKCSLINNQIRSDYLLHLYTFVIEILQLVGIWFIYISYSPQYFNFIIESFYFIIESHIFFLKIVVCVDLDYMSVSSLNMFTWFRREYVRSTFEKKNLLQNLQEIREEFFY